MAERTRPTESEIEKLKKSIRKPGENPYAKICAYGRNGSGKTRLAASFPKVLIIDCNEEGDRSVKGQPGVRVLPARTWQRVGEAYWYLKDGNHPFESVALDTVTEMNGLALEFVLGEAEERDPTRERAQPDKRTWGRAGQLMRGMLLAYRNLPMHVIFCAQERRIRDQDTEELVEITVDLPNSSRGVAMGSVGILGRMMPQETRVKRGGKTRKEWIDRLVVAPNEIVQTKDRTAALGRVLRNPTGTKIIEAWASSPPRKEED